MDETMDRGPDVHRPAAHEPGRVEIYTRPEPGASSRKIPVVPLVIGAIVMALLLAWLLFVLLAH